MPAAPRRGQAAGLTARWCGASSGRRMYLLISLNMKEVPYKNMVNLGKRINVLYFIISQKNNFVLTL
jgi:hypothetical protein